MWTKQQYKSKMDKYDTYTITTAVALLSGVVRSSSLVHLGLFYGIYIFSALACLLVLLKIRTTSVVPVKYDLVIISSYLYLLTTGILELLLWDQGASFARLVDCVLCTLLLSLVVLYTLEGVISRVEVFSHDDASPKVLPRQRVSLSDTN